MGVPHAVTQGPKLPPASGPILGGTETLGHGAHIYLSAAWQWPSALMPVSSQPDPVSWAQPGGDLGNVWVRGAGRTMMGNIAVPHWLLRGWVLESVNCRPWELNSSTMKGLEKSFRSEN